MNPLKTYLRKGVADGLEIKRSVRASAETSPKHIVESTTKINQRGPDSHAIKGPIEGSQSKEKILINLYSQGSQR